MQKKKNKKRVIFMYFMIGACLFLSACGTGKEERPVEDGKTDRSDASHLQSESGKEDSGKEDSREEGSGEEDGREEDSNTDHAAGSRIPPSKEEVLAMRAVVLEGMSEEEINRLTENIKVANLAMESAWFHDNLFDRLSDPDSPYWQYFDKTGEIQLGWWYKGQIVDKQVIMRAENVTEAEFAEREYEPGIEYNRFDAGNFMELMEDMQSSVQNQMLSADLQQLIDLAYMASATHEMEYANQLYQILHGLDYYLLRYGIEDVGVYTQDQGTASAYYGVLAVYGATPYELEETDS